MKRISTLIILLSHIFIIKMSAINYYVSTTGSDSKDGRSLINSFKTINKATGLVNPGDTVFVADGTYNGFSLNRSGNATAYIVIKSINKHGAKIVGSGDGYAGIAAGAMFFEINGFEVTNPAGHGISVENCSHVRVFYCHSHHNGNSGISGAWGDFYHFEGNICHHNASLSWYSGISIYQAKSIGDNSPGFHSIIRGNICYSNLTLPENGPHTDGNGIIIDDWNHTQDGGTPYGFAALVENNLCYDNGGGGVKVVWSDNITVRNNTCYHNSKDLSDAGTYRGEFYCQQSRGCIFTNNIGWANPAINSNNSGMMDKASPSGLSTVPNIWANNIFYEGTNQLSTSTGDGSSPTLINNIAANPKFISPGTTGTANFHLQAGSPAIDTGTISYGLSDYDLDGNARIQGSKVDLGCYETAGGPVKPTIYGSLSKSGVTGASFIYTITAYGNPTSFNATPLPAGLTVNKTTGVISGNPTTAGTTNVTVSATNAQGTSTATLVITISAPSKPTITSALTATGMTGIPFLYQIKASDAPVSFSASPLPSGLSVNTSTGKISGIPTTEGTTNITIIATNAQGQGSATLVITISKMPSVVSLWKTTDVPTTVSDPDASPVEVGVKFKSDVPGKITAIRFYKGTGNTGTHVGNLWRLNGSKLATITFTGETASGWQEAQLSVPVAIKADTVYVVSYYAPSGHYSSENNGLTNGKNNPPLHALANSTSPNGVYKYGNGGGFPTESYNATNYWVDVVFAPDAVKTFSLTVENGNGSGNYVGGTKFNIAANVAPSGKLFSKWTGDVQYLSNEADSLTEITMPEKNIVITATYKEINSSLNEGEFNFSAYPNPADGYFNVSFNQPYNGTITIINSSGIPVYQQKVTDADKICVNISDWPAGIYLLKFNAKNKYTSILFIKN